jgi:hypothetical protein
MDVKRSGPHSRLPAERSQCMLSVIMKDHTDCNICTSGGEQQTLGRAQEHCVSSRNRSVRTSSIATEPSVTSSTRTVNHCHGRCGNHIAVKMSSHFDMLTCM